MSDQDMNSSSEHWLVRPTTIKKLWWGGYTVLAVTVLLELLVPVKGYFGVDDWMGFGAVFGFLSCVAMVLVAKGLGFVLKREEDYYEVTDAEEGEHD